MKDDKKYGEYQEQLDRFSAHDEQSQQLYDEFKEVFDLIIRKSKNQFTYGGNVRDLSEMVKSLSSIRSDAINATTQAFNAKIKIRDLELKASKVENEASESANTAALMRKLTETIHSRDDKGMTSVMVANTLDKNKKDISKELLAKRIRDELDSGNIRINANENAMKYDFSKSGGKNIDYRYDPSLKKTVVISKVTGDPILDYPDERIPEEYTYEKTVNGVPYTKSGSVLEIL